MGAFARANDFLKHGKDLRRLLARTMSWFYIEALFLFISYFYIVRQRSLLSPCSLLRTRKREKGRGRERERERENDLFAWKKEYNSGSRTCECGLRIQERCIGEMFSLDISGVLPRTQREIRRRRGLTATARYATRINVMRDRGDTRASSVNVMRKSFIDVRLFRVSCSLFSNRCLPSGCTLGNSCTLPGRR